MNGTFVSEEFGIVSDETISDLVQTLECIGRGSCRQVFDLGDVVLKVNVAEAHKLHGSCETESAHWEALEGTDHEYLFAAVLASGDGWLLMEKADGVCTSHEDGYHEVLRRASNLGISDLFSANLGMFGGECKVIDYATGDLHGGPVEYDEEEEESEHCECGEHECRACYPNGCDCCCSLHQWDGCDEWEGCNVRYCEWCDERATQEFTTWFGFVPTSNVACKACAQEQDENTQAETVQCKRQGRFVPFMGGTDDNAWLVLDAVTQARIHLANQTACTTEPCVCGCALILNK